MEQLLMNSTSSQTFRKKRCVGYARVSTQEQAEEGYSIDAKFRQFKSIVNGRTWNAWVCMSIEARAGRTLKAARRCSNFFKMPRMETSML